MTADDYLIILKLGGSVITKKEMDKPTLNYENLQRIAREISDSSFTKLVVVHGAGSFGHPFAKKYGIGDEIQNDQELHKKMLGFSITQHAVKELNSVVCEYLRIRGVLAISIQPSSFILTKNKRIYSANLDLIRKYLDLGFVPVIYGDVVLDNDESIKMAVLSGDQIISYLALNLKPERVILASDVDGIFNKDPKKYPDARLLRVVNSLEDIEPDEGVETAEVVPDTAEFEVVENAQVEVIKRADVTGGMMGKLQELLELADMGVESEIVNANRRDVLKKAINHEEVTGTLIKRKSTLI